ERILRLPADMPRGYHRLIIEVGSHRGEALVIAAPWSLYSEAASEAARLWGLFLPVYAMHRESSWGAGDFSDLREFMSWTAEQGGNFVATLPLLTTLWELH